MYSLLLDSSDKNLSIGIGEDGKVIDSISHEAWQRQSEVMVDEINQILERNSLTRHDIKAVVVTKGPGSYTGVRIAMTIAKTMSFALRIPLYLVSSLEAMRIPGKTTVCLMNARSKRSYFGVYADGEAIISDRIMENSSVLNYLDGFDCAISGDVNYLGLDATPCDILANLANCIDPKYLVKEPLGASPVYLKDSYDTEMKVIVRKAHTADLKTIHDIEVASIKNPYTYEQLEYELLHNAVGYFYVAVCQCEVVGFIDFMITFDSSTINQIAVNEKYRNRGIGKMLLNEMLKVCRSQKDHVDFMTLEVRKSNENAHKFYLNNSFEDIVVKKAYYEDGEDAIYMVRNIIND